MSGKHFRSRTSSREFQTTALETVKTGAECRSCPPCIRKSQAVADYTVGTVWPVVPMGPVTRGGPWVSWVFP